MGTLNAYTDGNGNGERGNAIGNAIGNIGNVYDIVHFVHGRVGVSSDGNRIAWV